MNGAGGVENAGAGTRPAAVGPVSSSPLRRYWK